MWAHSSHLGDARASEKHEERLVNFGRLVREQHGEKAALIGFTTHRGTVTAASDWDAPAELKKVPPALPESFEALLHETRCPGFLIGMREPAPEALRQSKLERSIGAVYHAERTELERAGHYFSARLAEQFDAVCFFDETHAVEPLERVHTDTVEAPLTYPFAV